MTGDAMKTPAKRGHLDIQEEGFRRLCVDERAPCRERLQERAHHEVEDPRDEGKRNQDGDEYGHDGDNESLPKLIQVVEEGHRAVRNGRDNYEDGNEQTLVAVTEQWKKEARERTSRLLKRLGPVLRQRQSHQEPRLHLPKLFR